MFTGVANVRTNFYRDSLISPPSGRMFNQKSCLLIFFESYEKSVFNNLKIYTHLSYANELAEPTQLKNLIPQSIACSCETWNELVSGFLQIFISKFQ